MMGLIVFLCVVVSATNVDRVRLRDVQVVTGVRGQKTQGRRSSPVDQLTCLHTDDSSIVASSIQCRNVGWNGNDVEWRCEAPNMPNGFDLDVGTVVSCEGFDYPDDPYILAGSCGIEYRIKRTSIPPPPPPPPPPRSFHRAPQQQVPFDWSVVIIFSIAIIMLSICCIFASREEQGRRRYRESPPPPPPYYAPVYPSQSAYNAGYSDASWHSYWAAAAPVRPVVRETVVVRESSPPPPPPPPETHTSVSHATTKRR